MCYLIKIIVELAPETLHLYRQPIVPSCAEFQRSFYEILLRCQVNGSICAPTELIRQAESDLWVDVLDRCVVYELLRYLAGSKDSATYTVNISGLNLNERFLDVVISWIEHFHVNPTQLCLEVTERKALSLPTETLIKVKHLKELGCSLALDDFGAAGYLSFKHLEVLRPTFLKIDGYFIRRLLTSSFAEEVISSLIRITNSIHIQTIAECIEQEDQWRKLQELGISFGQGYYFARPEFLQVCGFPT